MDQKKRLSSNLSLAALVASLVGFGTVKLYAETCIFDCGDCIIEYMTCDACTTNGCNATGMNCQNVCWSCAGGTDRGCSS